MIVTAFSFSLSFIGAMGVLFAGLMLALIDLGGTRMKRSLPVVAARISPRQFSGCGRRFTGPNSSTPITTCGSPGPGSAVPSAIAHNCSTRFFLASESGSVDAFSVLTHWKGHAALVKQATKPLVADVLDDPLSDQKVGRLSQTPGRKGTS